MYCQQLPCGVRNTIRLFHVFFMRDINFLNLVPTTTNSPPFFKKSNSWKPMSSVRSPLHDIHFGPKCSQRRRQAGGRTQLDRVRSFRYQSNHRAREKEQVLSPPPPPPPPPPLFSDLIAPFPSLFSLAWSLHAPTAAPNKAKELERPSGSSGLSFTRSNA